LRHQLNSAAPQAEVWDAACLFAAASPAAAAAAVAALFARHQAVNAMQQLQAVQQATLHLRQPPLLMYNLSTAPPAPAAAAAAAAVQGPQALATYTWVCSKSASTQTAACPQHTHGIDSSFSSSRQPTLLALKPVLQETTSRPQPATRLAAAAAAVAAAIAQYSKLRVHQGCQQQRQQQYLPAGSS
jgi:hypothetical protein